MSKICSELTVRQINVNHVILANFVNLKNNAHTYLVSVDDLNMLSWQRVLSLNNNCISTKDNCISTKKLCYNSALITSVSILMIH